ncbi:Aste57867_25153 [Aphanomyces stellatus]|uniref:Aste57867_25153 protein n=1 Tax=Aphanomyces stellatus TaxID=120398 RepID=A0A485LWX6_9STRA|nr:hypothetical protein As57867_025075 [Aphanomyces stellatus]VFU01782.1 Aste57867_25153 [Aphanomyces stellatus]
MHDANVYGAERPGYIHPRRDQPSTPRGPDVSDERVQEWIDFMVAHDIKHVLCLLTREELRFYSSPLLHSYDARFKTVTHVDLSSRDWQLQTLLASLVHATDAKERIVVHCTTGQSRTANVLALWVHRRHDVGVDDAVADVFDCATKSRTTRKPTAESVLRLLLNTHGIPTSARGLPTSARATPPSSARLPPPLAADICFVQMGGRIDAAPSNELAMEIGNAAVSSMLNHAACTAAAEFVCVGRKDAKDICAADLNALLATIHETKRLFVIITIALEGMRSTAEYVHAARRRLPSSKTVVVFTSASVPAGTFASDAAFNVGCAIGAIRFLAPGVYVCMQGQVQSVDCHSDPPRLDKTDAEPTA